MIVNFAGDIPLQGANGFELGIPFGDTLGDIGFGSRIGTQSPDRDDMECAVGISVAAAIKAMSDRFAGRGRDRVHAAECREAGLRSQAFGIVTGSQQ